MNDKVTKIGNKQIFGVIQNKLIVRSYTDTTVSSWTIVSEILCVQGKTKLVPTQP